MLVVGKFDSFLYCLTGASAGECGRAFTAMSRCKQPPTPFAVSATRMRNYQGGCIRKVPSGRNLDRVSLPRLGRGNCMVCAFVDGTLVFRVVGCGEVEWRVDLEKHGGRLLVVERRSQIADW